MRLNGLFLLILRITIVDSRTIIYSALFNEISLVWQQSLISGKNDVHSKCFYPSKMCVCVCVFFTNQISKHIFLICNLITGCFLSHCNPIMCNLWLLNALSLSHTHTHTHTRIHTLTPASQVPAFKLIAFPPLAGAEAGGMWVSEVIRENALQVSVRNERWRLREEERNRLREKEMKDGRAEGWKTLARLFCQSVTLTLAYHY